MNNVQTLLAYSVTRRVVCWVAARAWFMIFFAVVFPLAWPQDGVVMSMQPRPWPDVPELTADGWSSELLGPLATEAEALRWRKLADALEKLTADAAATGLPLPEPLEAWAEWVVPVGRLSFETGRAVVTLTSAIQR